jgi:hypothetical protein
MIDRIQEHSGVKRRRFLVYWEGFPDEPTWEPEGNLRANSVYHEYIANLPPSEPTARKPADAPPPSEPAARQESRNHSYATRDFSSEVREGTVKNPTGSVGLLKEPTDSREPHDFVRFVTLDNDEVVTVLEEVSSEKGTKYFHIQSCFGGHQGWVKSDYIMLAGKLGPTTYHEPSVEDDDEMSRCPACNDVLADGSQCMCSA